LPPGKRGGMNASMTSGHFTQIGLLVLSSPDRAAAMVMKAYKKAKCHMADTARALDVHPATLRRIVDRLGMREEMEVQSASVRGSARHHGSLGGRPPTKK
jgi:hypothetical protein